jgi:site-specific DNA recombinase
MTRVAGYVRVSTADQAAFGWNLAEDRELIRERCPDGAQLEFFDDGGRQGDDPNRPGLLAMLSRLDEFDIVIMRQQDRISRDPVIWGTAAAAFRSAGVRVETFSGPIDLDTPQGRFMANMMAAVGKLEKEQTAQRVRQAKAARAKAGGHPGGKRPYGYMLVDTGAKGAHGRPIRELRPHPTERQAVVRMFTMAEATSQRQIAAILNHEGIPSSNGLLWVQSTVARVLSSELYLGKIRRKVDGVWEVHEGRHEAIVDDDLWHRVNRSRATPERRVGGRPMLTGHALTRGLGRCGACGSALVPVASYGGRPEVYKCLGRQTHGPEFCQQPSVRRELVDEALLEALKNRYLDLDGARERVRLQKASELPLAHAAVADAERELARAESRIAKITRGWQDEVIPDDEYMRQRAQLEEELSGAAEALTQAQARVEQIKASPAITDAEEAVLRRLADLKALVSGTVDQARDVEALRTILRQLFMSVELCSPDHPFGHGGDGVMCPQDDHDVRVGRYHLLLRLRPEAIDWTRFEPIKQPLPDAKPTTSTCR